MSFPFCSHQEVNQYLLEGQCQGSSLSSHGDMEWFYLPLARPPDSQISGHLIMRIVPYIVVASH